jgi:hypothetical protein
LDGLQIGAACECNYAGHGERGLKCGGQIHKNIPLGLKLFVSESPKCCRIPAQSTCRARLRRNTVTHQAKFARRMQLKSVNCRP